MSRRRRTDLSHPLLHVYQRGADRQDIFSSDRDRRLFESLLSELPGRFGVSIHCHALMHNHVHLVVDRSAGDVSAGMQFVFSRYALAYNEANGRSGPLFEGRFGATEITSGAQLLQCSRYVHLNPLDFVPRRTITTYRWSSLPVYAGRRENPGWIDVDRLIRLVGSEPAEYVRFVLTPQPGDDWSGRPVQPWQHVTLDDVDEVVGHGRGPLADHRQLAIAAATELRIAGSTEIAAHHGLASPSITRNVARRARIRRRDDRAFDHRLTLVSLELRRRARGAGLPPEWTDRL